MELTIALVFCAILAAITFKVIWRPGGSKPIPGPKFSFPILGHLPLLGREPWLKFTQWKKLYGAIFAIKMGNYDTIVLNESKLIKEAFSRPEFSGRPLSELFKTATQGKGIGLNDGPLVAEQRDFALKSLRGTDLRTKHEESVHLELSQVLEDLDKKCGRPVAVKEMFAVHVTNAIWNIAMGHRFDHDDPQLPRICQAVAQIEQNDGPLATLSIFIPALSKCMPELSGRNKKFQAFADVYNFVQKAFDVQLPPKSTFGGPQNFKEAFIDEMERVGANLASSFHPSHNSFLYSAADIFMAAMETTATTLDWLLLYMANYPKVQKRVQAEIDEEIGTARRPALSDKDNTPYVEAAIQELLRFSSTAPLGGVFHRATEDTELRGYHIKKDTVVIANLYGLHYDQVVWGDPENFRPERFIDENGRVDVHRMRMILPFSTGKRSCIGENLARDQLYLYCTSIFQRFDVFCDKDTQIETTVGFFRAPKDFKLTFTKRFTDT